MYVEGMSSHITYDRVYFVPDWMKATAQKQKAKKPRPALASPGHHDLPTLSAVPVVRAPSDGFVTIVSAMTELIRRNSRK
jgi:hypothetical protein